MPCTMQTLSFNRTEENNRLKEIGDEATHELDMIREAIIAGGTPDFSADWTTWRNDWVRMKLASSAERSGPSEGVLTDLNLLNKVGNLLDQQDAIRVSWRANKGSGIRNELIAQQVEHRREDIKRLGHVFVENGDWGRLRLVMEADPEQPLEPQLGFDPDEF